LRFGTSGAILAFTNTGEQHMSAIPLAPTDRDETPAEFFARISSPPTPHFDKLREFAKQWRIEEELHAERKFRAQQDAYWEARAADREELGE
jgi:hypothetical protein